MQYEFTGWISLAKTPVNHGWLDHAIPQYPQEGPKTGRDFQCGLRAIEEFAEFSG
jgi:hypothetical protein